MKPTQETILNIVSNKNNNQHIDKNKTLIKITTKEKTADNIKKI